MTGNRRLILAVPLAVLVTGLLAFLTTCSVASSIESDLAARARTALGAEGLPVDGVRFHGRDATLGGMPADQAQRAAQIVGGVSGVRTVDVEKPTGPSGTGNADHTKRVETALARVLGDSPITFQPESAVLTPQATRTIAEIVGVMRTAPNSMTFEVGGHVAKVPGGNTESANALSQARADAVARQLVAAGIERDRIKAIGYGATRPQSGDQPDKSDDRRVEITVK